MVISKMEIVRLSVNLNRQREVFKMQLGSYIKSRRKNIGLTQKQLAELVGVSQDAISQYENGNREPGFFIFIKLCKVLGMQISDFMEGM